MNKATVELRNSDGGRVRVTPGGEDEAYWLEKGYSRESRATEPELGDDAPETPGRGRRRR